MRRVCPLGQAGRLPYFAGSECADRRDGMGREHDLSARVQLPQVGVRVGHVGERIQARHEQPERAPVGQLRDPPSSSVPNAIDSGSSCSRRSSVSRRSALERYRDGGHAELFGQSTAVLSEVVDQGGHRSAPRPSGCGRRRPGP